MDQILNASTYGELKDLMDGDFDQLLQTFYESSTDSIDALKAAAQQSDFERLRVHAHSLKGSSAILGAERLAELCREMEMAAVRGDAQKIHASLTALEGIYSVVVTTLRGGT